MTLLLLFACQTQWEIQQAEAEGTYSTAARAFLPAPADSGDAPFAGTLGPPRNMVMPVGVGPATLTREGSGGPPMLTAGEPQSGRVAYQVRGPNPDAHRKTAGPGINH